jgi:hypothetical protein
MTNTATTTLSAIQAASQFTFINAQLQYMTKFGAGAPVHATPLNFKQRPLG